MRHLSFVLNQDQVQFYPFIWIIISKENAYVFAVCIIKYLYTAGCLIHAQLNHFWYQARNIPALGVNTMPADALAPKVTSASAGMVLAV